MVRDGSIHALRQVCEEAYLLNSRVWASIAVERKSGRPGSARRPVKPIDLSGIVRGGIVPATMFSRKHDSLGFGRYLARGSKETETLGQDHPRSSAIAKGATSPTQSTAAMHTSDTVARRI